MDGARTSYQRYAVIAIIWRVGGRGHDVEAVVWTYVELCPVQILVKVANIQAKTLKAEVE